MAAIGRVVGILNRVLSTPGRFGRRVKQALPQPVRGPVNYLDQNVVGVAGAGMGSFLLGALPILAILSALGILTISISVM